MQPSEEIKEKMNIVDLIGEYVQLKKAGANFRARCPFHDEKTPSFMVSPAKQIWHCFGCGLGGDVFEFIKQSEGVEFPEALQLLAARTGVVLRRPTVEYREAVDKKKVLYEINELAAKYYAKVLLDSQSAQPARDYLAKRGFRPETIQKWQIGFAPDDFHFFENFVTSRGYQRAEAVDAGLLVKKEPSVGRQGTEYYDRFRSRIMFPIFDFHGRVVAFTGRVLAEEGDSVAKYVNSPETLIYSKGQILYGMNFAKTEIRKADSAIMVEGNVDVITCHEFGFANAVGSSGTALTEHQLGFLKRFSNNLDLAFDVDAAGISAGRRAVELALSLGFNVRVIDIPTGMAKDPDELIRRDLRLWQDRVTKAQPFLDFYFSLIFAKIDIAESSGKKQAVSEVLPLLSLLPDPIDRAHYVQKLAAKLGLDERLILDLLNRRLAVPARPERVKSDNFSPNHGLRKGLQELLEERALGLLLKFPENLEEDWQKFTPEDFTTSPAKEIFSQIQPRVLDHQFTFDDFYAKSPQSRQIVDLLVFAVENELSALPEWKLEDVKQEFLGNLKRYNLKERMRILAARIREAEQIGRQEETKILTGEFNHLIRELAKFHA